MLDNEKYGKVKRLLYGSGFGFITGDDDGIEYFFHAYEVLKGSAGFERLTPGDPVRFYAEPNSYQTKNGEKKEGFKAVRVRPC